MSKLLLDFTDVLAECIEAIEQEKMSVADCLARYPEYAAELNELLPVMTEMRAAPPVPPSLQFRQQARRRLLRQLPPMPHENVTFFQALRHRWQSISLFQPTRRVSMTWIIIIATIVSIAAGGGATAYAADAAVPGDTLYALDLTLEEMQLSLATTPEAQVALQLAFAEERLEEAQALAAANDTADLPEALDGYGEAIAAIAQTVGGAEGANQEALLNLVTQSLAAHDVVLADLLPEEALAAGENGPGMPEQPERPEQPGQPEDGAMGDARCSVVNDNPVAEQIAEQFDVSAEEVMGYFCDGFGFGEIMLAYNISEQTGIPVSDLLAWRDEGMGWGQIMQEADVIGQPEETPDGRPDDAGMPDDVDLPENDAPQGPPDDAGKPEDTPGRDNNPGNAPQNPPDDAGKPEDTPDKDNNPGDMPQDPPGNNSGNNPGDMPQDPPGDNSGNNPGDMPQDPPGDNSGGDAGDMPQDPPGDDSGGDAGDMPQDPPGDDSGGDAGDMPQDPPGDDSGGGMGGNTSGGGRP